MQSDWDERPKRFGELITMKNVFVFFLFLLVLYSFKAEIFPYAINTPDERFELTSELDEISGIDMLSDSLIVAVQDEKAYIYYLDANSGEIIDKIDFGKNADYEGISHVKKHFYVLRSDGNLFKVKPGKETKEYEFKKSKGFDFEGICFDQKNNRLLIACKTQGDKSKHDNFYIYSFSLETKSYGEKPVFKLKKSKVHPKFKPSAIAIHPDDSIYVLSSFSKTLIVLSSEGELINKVVLEQDLFQQPEGITFNSKGDLFISNEKNRAVPTILKFNHLDWKEWYPQYKSDLSKI